MSNVQEALKAAIEALENINRWLPTINQKGLRDYEYEALLKCKAALAEIEKCEPVAYDKNKIRSEVMSKSPIPFGVCDAIDLTMQAMERFITSPQPREWVGLSDDQIERAICALSTDYYKARAIERELKQLNTKG